jgi:hypothetical protein
MIMAVGELINELSKFPEHLNVEVDDGNCDFEIKSIDKTLSSFDIEATVCNITIKSVL